MLGGFIGKPGRATFEKRQREQSKKVKQEDKRLLRAQRKEAKEMGAVAQSDRVFLRKWSQDNLDSELEAALAIWAEYEDGPITEDEATDLILDKNELNWAVIEKESSEVVGSCGFVAESEFFEMKLHIRKRDWSRGLGMETAILALGYVRANYTQVRFIFKINSDNSRGIQLLKRLGFSHDGITQKNKIHFIQE